MPQLRAVAGHTVRVMTDIAGPYLLPSITHVETSEPLVALTFDDGPHPEYTARLLDVLERYGARVTFFALGMHAAKHPELIRRQVERGHVVGNHTFNHVKFPRLPHAERMWQIRSTEEALGSNMTRLFRPPWGGQTLPSRIDLWRSGYQVIMWNAIVDDWLAHDGNVLAARIEQEMRPGSIVLLHDGIRDLRDNEATRRPTVDAVETLLQRTGGKYRFVTVPELMAAGHPVRVNWFDPWYW